MSVREARVTRLSMSAPDDVAPLEAAFAAGRMDPHAIRAVFAKTEGNGCVNDFTRAFAVQSVLACLARHGVTDAAERVALVMSGGTEGALSPHWLVIEAIDSEAPMREGALAIGVAHTPTLRPEDIGRMAQVDAVADAVASAMADAGIAHADDVHFVQVKCPLVTSERVAEAAARGAAVRTADTLKSMGVSRGAAALGVAVALGEVAHGALSDETIGGDLSVFSGRASTSAGVELMNNEVVVLGRSDAWAGSLTIESGVMADAIDVEPVRAILERQGLMAAGRLVPGAEANIVALLAKAEPSPTGRLRGFRHTMLDDSDISATRHARGFVAGALAGVVGHAELFVSGGAEHQGPPGGGPVALITRRPA